MEFVSDSKTAFKDYSYKGFEKYKQNKQKFQQKQSNQTGQRYQDQPLITHQSQKQLYHSGLEILHQRGKGLNQLKRSFEYDIKASIAPQTETRTFTQKFDFQSPEQQHYSFQRNYKSGPRSKIFKNIVTGEVIDYSLQFSSKSNPQNYKGQFDKWKYNNPQAVKNTNLYDYIHNQKLALHQLQSRKDQNYSNTQYSQPNKFNNSKSAYQLARFPEGKNSRLNNSYINMTGQDFKNLYKSDLQKPKSFNPITSSLSNSNQAKRFSTSNIQNLSGKINGIAHFPTSDNKQIYKQNLNKSLQYDQFREDGLWNSKYQSKNANSKPPPFYKILSEIE